jgi:hypothetical protein
MATPEEEIHVEVDLEGEETEGQSESETEDENDLEAQKRIEKVSTAKGKKPSRERTWYDCIVKCAPCCGDVAFEKGYQRTRNKR